MSLFRFQLDPVARKRWARFRALRRAWFALLALGALFLLSCGAELICNRDPLAVRYQGRWFFPLFRFYPEDRFTGNGRMTRPDYKRIAAEPAFRAHPGNRMIFAPIPFGPDEIIRPDTLPVPPGLTLRLAPLTRAGAVHLDADGIVRRPQGAETFFPGVPSPDGAVLSDHWRLPPEFEAALAARRRNEAAPPLAITLTHRQAVPPLTARISLATYQPRAAPPATLRLAFEDVGAAAAPLDLRLDAALNPQTPVPAAWSAAAPAERNRLLDAARAVLDGAPNPGPLDLDLAGARYRATLLKPEIRWPHPPVAGHWLGIDNAGRDVLARLLYGLRIALFFGLILTLAALLIGIGAGAVQGYYGGRIDLAGQRFIEIWSALPFLYIMILLGAVYGRSFLLLLVCYGLFNWIGISYYMRAEFLRLRHLPFVDAARVMGLTDRAIMFRHILPNALVPVITFFPFSLVGAIGSLAALDFLGFGLPPPTPSWGEMLQQAQQYRWAWWLVLYPSLALFTVMLLGIFVGEGVRQAYDPHRPVRWE